MWSLSVGLVFWHLLRGSLEVEGSMRGGISDGTDTECVAFHGLAWIQFLVLAQGVEILMLASVQA